MQVQVDIAFDQLLKVIMALTPDQRKKLLAEVNRDNFTKNSNNLENLLLNGPTATKQELETIKKNRIAINQWREI